VSLSPVAWHPTGSITGLPHCSLKGLTPSEVLAGLCPDNIEHLKSLNLKPDKTEKPLKQEIKCTECIK